MNITHWWILTWCNCKFPALHARRLLQIRRKGCRSNQNVDIERYISHRRSILQKDYLLLLEQNSLQRRIDRLQLSLPSSTLNSATESHRVAALQSEPNIDRKKTVSTHESPTYSSSAHEILALEAESKRNRSRANTRKHHICHRVDCKFTEIQPPYVVNSCGSRSRESIQET